MSNGMPLRDVSRCLVAKSKPTRAAAPMMKRINRQIVSMGYQARSAVKVRAGSASLSNSETSQADGKLPTSTLAASGTPEFKHRGSAPANVTNKTIQLAGKKTKAFIPDDVTAAAAVFDRAGEEPLIKLLEKIRAMSHISVDVLARAAVKSSQSLLVGDTFEAVRISICEGRDLEEVNQKAMSVKERELLELLNQLSAEPAWTSILQYYFTGMVWLLTQNEHASRADVSRNIRLAICAIGIEETATHEWRRDETARLLNWELHTRAPKHFAVELLFAGLVQPVLVREWLQQLTIRQRRLLALHLAKESKWEPLWNWLHMALTGEPPEFVAVNVRAWWAEEHAKIHLCAAELDLHENQRFEVPELASEAMWEAASLLGAHFTSPIVWPPAERFSFIRSRLAEVNKLVDWLIEKEKQQGAKRHEAYQLQIIAESEDSDSDRETFKSSNVAQSSADLERARRDVAMTVLETERLAVAAVKLDDVGTEETLKTFTEKLVRQRVGRSSQELVGAAMDRLLTTLSTLSKFSLKGINNV